jgi:hypothetical protein
LQSQRPPIKEEIVKPRAPEVEYATQAAEDVSPPRNKEEEEQKASVFPDTYYSVSKKPTTASVATYRDSNSLILKNKGTIPAETPFRYTFENLAHLFQGSAPIPYQPRRGNQVDEQIA